MNIIDAIRDDRLFRTYVTGEPDGSLESWSKWLAFLRLLYGLPCDDNDADLIQQCTGRDPGSFSSEGFDESLVLCGRRGGKSKMIALVGAFEAILSGKEKNLSPGEIGMVAILSPTRFQSRIIHSYLKGVFESTPLLQQELVETRKDSFKLRNGVELSIITGSPNACRGFSVIAAIVDEVAFFQTSEESKISCTELIRALRPSLASTNGRLLCVGSPYAARGYFYTTWKKHYGNDTGSVLVWNGPSLTMNPTLSAKIVQRAIGEDPVAANVEYCVRPGLFREDVDNFVPRSLVESLVVPGRTEIGPRSDIKYSAFADVSGGRSDDAALAIGHKVGRLIVIDFLETYAAPHDPYEVVGRMCQTIRRYGCDRAIGDAYAAEWSKCSFENHGIKYRRATSNVWKEGSQARNKVTKPKSQLYLELLPRLNAAEVELLDNEKLIDQLSNLERRVRSGSRDSVDHPPGGHDDAANAIAGVVDAVSQRPIRAGLGVDSYSRVSPVQRDLDLVQ